MTELHRLGWNPFFEASFAPFAGGAHVPARVAVQHKGHYLLYAEAGELQGRVTGKLRFRASGAAGFPVVGDWVVISARPGEGAATIVDILPRQTKFSRKVAGSATEEQIIAANLDVLFLVSGLDNDFSPRRLERYLVLAAESGARPVIVLNKTDLCDDLPDVLATVRTLAGDIPVLVTSAARNEGLEQLTGCLAEGQTGALLGSSGVGKSSIANQILGTEHLRTMDVRESDSRGRHTTTHRELILLPTGGMLIDTPGLRELQLWGEEETVHETFDDIEALALECKFTNCRHDTEPGCAVQRAIEDGRLDPGRAASFQKLQRELDYQIRKQDLRERLRAKERAKKLTVTYKKHDKRPEGPP